jgi:hypothetical protein
VSAGIGIRGQVVNTLLTGIGIGIGGRRESKCHGL